LRKRRSTLRTSRRALRAWLRYHCWRVCAPARSTTHSGRGSGEQHVADTLPLVFNQACHKQGCVPYLPLQARALMAPSLVWPATSSVIRERRMLVPDPAVQDLARVPMRAGDRFGKTIRHFKAPAQGDRGCALSDTWPLRCRCCADCRIVREGALAAAR